MIFLESVLLIAALTALLLIEPGVTVTMACALGAASVLYYLVAAPRFRRWGELSIAIEADMIKWINQSFANISFAKLSGKEPLLADEVGRLSDERAVYECRSSTSLQISAVISGDHFRHQPHRGFRFLVAGGRPPEELVATAGVFGMAALRLLPSMNRLLAGLSELRRRSAFIDEIHADLFSEPNRGRRPGSR